MQRFIFVSTLILSLQTFANVVGSDFQNFNPASGGIDFVTVQSSETLEPWILNFGLFLNHAYNTLPYHESIPSSIQRNRSRYSDTVTGMDLNIGLGISKNWEVGLNLPYIANQSINSDGVTGNFTNTGNSEYRVSTKVKVWGDQKKGIALIPSANFNLIGNNPYVGEGGGPSYNFEVAFDRAFEKSAWALNIGYRWRNPGTPTDATLKPKKDSYLLSTGWSYLFTSIDTKLIAEIYGSLPAKPTEDTSSKSLSNLELLLGTKFDLTNQLAFHSGLTSEIISGTASPDLRVYLGVNWVMGPMTKKPKPIVRKEKDDNWAEAALRTPIEDTRQTFIIPDINFKLGSHRKVYKKSKQRIAEFVEFLENPPMFTELIIAGHTDSTGNEADNLILSRNRANTIADYMVKVHDIDRNKITTEGYGESKPIADNGNYQGRKQNRRVEFTIIRE